MSPKNADDPSPSQAIQVTEVDQEAGTLSLKMSDGERFELQILGAGLARLGSITAALAARITQAPLDPAEHVLDASRAFYAEEQAGKTVCVECDVCKLLGPGAATGERAKILARNLGWDCEDDHDHCPTHAQKQLSSGRAAPLPVVFSISQSIFLTRLDWLSTCILCGMSAEATLKNSYRIGLRRMLTELASELHYNPAELSQRVETLRALGAELPEAFRSDPEGKTFEWIAELFAHVCAEDNP